MSMAPTKNREWMKWIEVQKNAARAMVDGDLEEAISIVSRFLAADPRPQAQPRFDASSGNASR